MNNTSELEPELEPKVTYTLVLIIIIEDNYSQLIQYEILEKLVTYIFTSILNFFPNTLITFLLALHIVYIFGTNILSINLANTYIRYNGFQP